MLFGGAAFWLVLGSGFGLIASIKFHGPGFLADYPWLTYGRVYPAWSNLLVYGFCLPGALGTGLWLLARLGRAELARPWLVALAAKVWHLGVFAGLIGILRGSSAGFEWLEMPHYASVILLVAFLLLALCAFALHRSRGERPLHPSQWFALAALFWFPWIYSTAFLLLQVFPVRGIVQAAVAWWFAGNLLNVWLALAGLAAVFHLLPRLTERPLYSGHLALFIFCTLILFGTWTGIPGGAALPAWMSALSRAAAWLTLVPTCAVAASVILTCRGARTVCGGGPLCFIKFGVFALVIAGAMLALSALPPVSRVVEFTWFGQAEAWLRLYGFFAMTMFGAAYYILPRVAGFEFPFAKLVRLHFWSGVTGVLLLAVPLALGGMVQGFKLANAEVAFVDTTKATLLFLRLSTLGDLLVLFGNLLFLLNVCGMIARYYRSVCKTVLAAATARLEPAEVLR